MTRDEETWPAGGSPASGRLRLAGGPSELQSNGVEGLLARPAEPGDLECLYALGRQCFPAESWSEDGLEEELSRDNAVCEIAEVLGWGPVGYLVAWWVLDELHLLQIATHPLWRRRGIAAFLLDRLLALARGAGARVIFLEVRASNEAAHGLYETRGFATVGVRKRYYREPVEDALVMAWTGQVSDG